MNLLALALLQSLSFGAPVAQSSVPAIAVAPRTAAVEAVVVVPTLDAQAQLVTAASVAVTTDEYPSAWPREFEGRATGKYYGARYYSAAQGRFNTPDWSATPVPVPYADYRDPQTLNLYSYVQNRPTTRSDADGHCGPWCVGAGVGFIAGFYGSLAAQYREHGGFAGFSPQKALAAGVGGAASGVLFVASAGQSMASMIVAGAWTNTAGGSLARSIDGDESTAASNEEAIMIDVVSGAGGGVLAHEISTLAAPGIAQAKKTLEGQVNAGVTNFSSARSLAGSQAKLDKLIARRETLSAVLPAKATNFVVPVFVAPTPQPTPRPR